MPPGYEAHASPINLNGPLGPLTHRSTKTATVLIRMPKQLHGVRTADLHLELCRSRWMAPEGFSRMLERLVARAGRDVKLEAQQAQRDQRSDAPAWSREQNAGALMRKCAYDETALA